MDILTQLIRDEGSRRLPYTDTVGKLTIGVGRNLTDDGISDDEIMYLLNNDVKKVTEELQSRLPYFQLLDPVRQAVLVNMAFNMGFQGLETFTTFLSYVAHGDWDSAARAMLDSKWAREVKDRAVRLSEQMSTGEWR